MRLDDEPAAHLASVRSSGASTSTRLIEMSSSDIVAIVGIVGTLVGVCLGSLISWLIHKRSAEHADKTRFHERKLELYAQFASMGSFLISSYTVTGKFNPEDQITFARQLKTLILVASQPVCQAATTTGEILLEAATGEVTNRKAVNARFHDALATTITKMRVELGVESDR